MFGGLNEPFLPKVGAFAGKAFGAAQDVGRAIVGGVKTAGSATGDLLTGQTAWQKGGLIAGSAPEKKKRTSFSGAPMLATAN